MERFKLGGNANLAKLSRVGYTTIHGVKVLVIPVIENDIYIKTEEINGKKTLKVASLNIQVYENGPGSQENQNTEQQFGDKKYFVGKYGDTHYIKLGLSKDFIESHDDSVVDNKNSVILGNLKPFPLPSANEAYNDDPQSSDPFIETSDSDVLPF